MNLTTEEIIKGAREHYLIFGEDDGSVQFDYDADNEHKLLQAKFIPISDLIEHKNEIEKYMDEHIAETNTRGKGHDLDYYSSLCLYCNRLKNELNLINELIKDKQ